MIRENVGATDKDENGNKGNGGTRTPVPTDPSRRDKDAGKGRDNKPADKDK